MYLFIQEVVIGQLYYLLYGVVGIVVRIGDRKKVEFWFLVQLFFIEFLESISFNKGDVQFCFVKVYFREVSLVCEDSIKSLGDMLFQYVVQVGLNYIIFFFEFYICLYYWFILNIFVQLKRFIFRFKV